MGYLIHRDQVSVLESYHKDLTRCLVHLVKGRGQAEVEGIVRELVGNGVWPRGRDSNTSKEVLLLETLEQIIVTTGHGLPPSLPTILTCLQSVNSRVSERAMMMWKVAEFGSVVNEEIGRDGRVCDCLVKGLGGNLKPGWNPTVNKMRFLVLGKLEDGQRGVFNQSAERVYGFGKGTGVGGRVFSNPPLDVGGSDGYRSSDSDVDSVASSDMQLDRIKKVTVKRNFPGGTGLTVQRTVKEQMGEWRRGGGQPPTTITGVAPWAVKPTGRRQAGGGGVMRQPPSTTTGVAPWAVKGFGRVGGDVKALPKSEENLIEKEDEKEELSESVKSETPGLDRIHAFMSLIKPLATSKYTPWSMSQLCVTPTLLPNLKFHDLVFGRVLGKGAFSTVKYARMIKRNTTRKNWDEFAVKVISIKTIKENGYSQSVNREISVLRHLSHPGIARLVSSFRFRDGAYLVLEYAEGGDLHTLVTNNGSLEDGSAKFVCGEILAALCSVQAEGMVYGDLKPENVLITEAGHVKLGDFGGCRAVGREAREVLRGAMSAVDKLRDGDWRVREESKGGGVDLDGGEEKEDERVEGTAAYLPPEVISGSKHGYPSDVWSFGCLVFFCLAGKPPIIDVDNDETMRKVIKFAKEQGSGGDFFGKDSHCFSSGSKNVISRCCEVVVERRPTISEVSEDAWWGSRSVFDLHKGEAVELNVGKVKAGTVDKAWTRRQHSMIWSPQNEKYDFETEVGGKGGGAGGSRGDVDKYLARVIVESDEGDFGEEMEEKEEKEEEEDEKERFRRQLLNRIAE